MSRILFALMAFACFATLSPLSLFAQNIQHTKNKPDLGLRSDTRVDPSTLGMSFSIPLASYPGRAGHGLPVAITYNSKALRVDYRGVDSVPISGAITWTGVEFAEHSTAGWTSTLTPPRVEFTGMGQYLLGKAVLPAPICASQDKPALGIVTSSASTCTCRMAPRTNCVLTIRSIFSHSLLSQGHFTR
jgi:hypothetical protein